METYIDTDPGLDDAIAILAALRALELDVRGLTTVAGNIGLGLTSRNAARIATLAGQPELPVVPGAPGPLSRPGIDASDIHGDDGLGAVPFPEPGAAVNDAFAPDWLAERLTPDAQILALGPLTNIAALLRDYPEARPGRIIAMGGTVDEPGNTGPKAEFNIAADPEAARIVFSSGVPVVLVPLDVTRKVRAGADWLATLSDGPVARTVSALLGAYIDEGQALSRPLHDPCVTAYALAPELFEGTRMRIEVDTTAGATAGTLTCRPDPDSPVEVLTGVDAPEVLALLAGHLSD